NAEQAMQGAADILRQSKKVIGIGSPRASVESNFALRELVGEDVTQTGARVALAVRQAVKGKAREMAAAQKVADWQIAAIL
ncbi:hypothetical protein, partial [Escherichia coli]|uniref:hypothetical protein n=1 Tax=Escherichia coli TaxID=562 RepID=UPI0013AFD57C